MRKECGTKQVLKLSASINYDLYYEAISYYSRGILAWPTRYQFVEQIMN